MNMLLPIFILAVTFVLTSSAPADHLQEYEQAMLNKLHQPWLTPDKPPEYPRKGEYPCKGGICKAGANGCEDCQHAKPLDFIPTD